MTRRRRAPGTTEFLTGGRVPPAPATPIQTPDQLAAALADARRELAEQSAEILRLRSQRTAEEAHAAQADELRALRELCEEAAARIERDWEGAEDDELAGRLRGARPPAATSAPAIVSLSRIGDGMREAFPEYGPPSEEARTRIAAFNAKVRAARVRYIAGAIDLATTLRDDSMTEIDLEAERLIAPLSPPPTPDELWDGYDAAPVYCAAYPPERG